VPAGIFGDFAGDASGEGGSNCLELFDLALSETSVSFEF
jgi:hypothetical protein